MIGLHAARFASDWLRWLYFLSGLGGTLMVASGLVLWTVKRREKLLDSARPRLGFQLVAWLNVGVVAGLPLGIAAMLWANRVLPLAMAERAQWEIHVLFLAWALALGLAAFIREAKAWTILLGATGVLLVMIPIYNIFGTTRGLPNTIDTGDFVLAGIDLTLLVFGAAFLVTARQVASHRPRSKRARTPRSSSGLLPPAVPAPPVLDPAE